MGEFPRSGSKAKNGEEKKRGGKTDGNNNGQATHGAGKHAWRTQAAWANFSGFFWPPEPLHIIVFKILRVLL